MTSEPDRIETLDGLRGVAALVVLISHCGNAGFLPDWTGGGLGQMGVALFYVLSGFLMSHLYIRKPFDRVERRRYAVARVARVLPLFYFVVVIAGVVLLAGGPSFYGFHGTGMFLMNVLLIYGTDVLWSIPVEIQYYIVFVFIWMSYASGRHLTCLAVIIALQAATAVLSYLTIVEARILSFWMQFFLFGHLLALVLQTHGANLRRCAAHPMTAPAAWLVLAIAVIAPPEVRRELGWPVLHNFMDPVSAGYPALITVFALLAVGPFALLSNRLFRWLGGISFSLYLLHWPIVRNAKEILGEWAEVPGAGFAFVLITSLALSALANRVLELPAQTALRRRFMSPR